MLRKISISLGDIATIEQTNPVQDIKANGLQIWPFFRFYFIVNILSRTTPTSVSRGVVRSLLKNFFYGFNNLFKRYNYLAFSDTSERKLIKGVYVDKSLDYILSRLGNALLFELPLPDHFPKKKVATNYITSKYIIYVLTLLYAKLVRVKFEQYELLKKLLLEYSFEPDCRSIIRRNLAQIKVGELLCIIYKPKAVFLQNSYTNMGLIKGFRNKGVKVIEIQHGSITKSHEAYNVFKKLDNSYFPEFLLTFGSLEKELFHRTNYFINSDNVVPVGHYYLDYLAKRYTRDNRLDQIKNEYKSTVAVTSQDFYVENGLINFLKDVAIMDREVLILFVPRSKPIAYYDKFNFPPNMIIIDWLNTYEIIQQSDFHSTVFSTCAIEAPSLGIRNILINIDNLAIKHYQDVLTDSRVTQFVNTPDEFLNRIYNSPKYSKSVITESNRRIIKDNYPANIDQILRDLSLLK